MCFTTQKKAGMHWGNSVQETAAAPQPHAAPPTAAGSSIVQLRRRWLQHCAAAPCWPHSCRHWQPLLQLPPARLLLAAGGAGLAGGQGMPGLLGPSQLLHNTQLGAAAARISGLLFLAWQDWPAGEDLDAGLLLQPSTRRAFSVRHQVRQAATARSNGTVAAGSGVGRRAKTKTVVPAWQLQRPQPGEPAGAPAAPRKAGSTRAAPHRWAPCLFRRTGGLGRDRKGWRWGQGS